MTCELNVPNLIEFIQAQANDTKFRRAEGTVGKPNAFYSVDTDSVLLKVSPIDSASQRFFRANLKMSILRMCHYSLLAGHPPERQMQDAMGR